MYLNSQELKFRPFSIEDTLTFATWKDGHIYSDAREGTVARTVESTQLVLRFLCHQMINHTKAYIGSLNHEELHEYDENGQLVSEIIPIWKKIFILATNDEVSQLIKLFVKIKDDSNLIPEDENPQKKTDKEPPKKRSGKK